ncbi:TPA: AAA family ATPase, partial [Staphylococcus aureus]|nr:AAA family ATPase [Staphylococcus aureus]
MPLSKIIIKGFKKFKCLELDFNEHFSVLVGENEVGKSTILSAIDIVL